MIDELAELQARVKSLAPNAWEEQIAVNEAILRLQADDLVATRRLALALVKLGVFDRAEEVLEEALVLHPADDILMRRADDIARGRRTAVPETRTRSSRSSVERAPSSWIKAVHYDGGGWMESEGTELWISDPGQRDANGERLYTAAGDPRGRPSWRVGEEAGIYFGGTERVPFLVEIIQPPEFSPSLVQAADWAQLGDGERWPWVTWVRVLQSVPSTPRRLLASLVLETHRCSSARGYEPTQTSIKGCARRLASPNHGRADPVRLMSSGRRFNVVKPLPRFPPEDRTTSVDSNMRRSRTGGSAAGQATRRP